MTKVCSNLKKNIFLETVRIMVMARILLKLRYLIEMETSVEFTRITISKTN